MREKERQRCMVTATWSLSSAASIMSNKTLTDAIVVIVLDYVLSNVQVVCLSTTKGKKYNT